VEVEPVNSYKPGKLFVCPKMNAGIFWLNTRFQASVAKYLRTAFFWFITQGVVVIHYRRFGSTYRSRLQI